MLVRTLLVSSLSTLMLACTALGEPAEGERLSRMQASPQWQDGGFLNQRPAESASTWTLLKASLTQMSPHSRPEAPIAVLKRSRQDFDLAPDSGLRVTWLGHSNLIVEIDGYRVLIDPIWGERPSPISWLGPTRWYESPLALEELPRIDAVLISHDHYDHLDHQTVLALLEKQIPWVVPLGVGAHLQAWGMDNAHITELDWWASYRIGDLELTATPARHFSGRGFDGGDQNGGPTLWAGWSIAGPKHRVYYSGDTALFDALTDIGERLGPFDLTLIATGAYNRYWRDVHLGPEQAVRAHQLVGGKLLLPVHWGLFNLSFHGWTEPVERLLAEAQAQQVAVVIPKPGEMLEPALASGPVKAWWPQLPWERADQSPVISSGTEHLMLSGARQAQQSN